MGKRQIGELQPFELVITLVIADLAVLPMQETGLSLINGIVPLIMLVSIHFFISFIARKSFLGRQLIDGKPVIVINPDGIQYEKLKELNLNINELQDSLRASGYFHFDEVEYAIIETNGKMSIIPKSEKRPVSPKDLELKPVPDSIDLALIIDGKVMKKNLTKLKLKESFLLNYLNKAKVNELKELLVVTMSTNGILYIQPKKGKCKVFSTNFKGGAIK
jgi:uncharacterized membrane protein YcaP (DUF421 family)